MPSISLDEREETRGPPLCSKHYCQRCLLHSLALFCRWRHCDIGITGARFCASQTAPRSLQNANHGNKRKYSSWGERGGPLRRAHGVHPSLLHCSRQATCEGVLSLKPWCYVAHPPPLQPHRFPLTSLNAPAGEQRFASCFGGSVMIASHGLRLTQR